MANQDVNLNQENHKTFFSKFAVLHNFAAFTNCLICLLLSLPLAVSRIDACELATFALMKTNHGRRQKGCGGCRYTPRARIPNKFAQGVRRVQVHPTATIPNKFAQGVWRVQVHQQGKHTKQICSRGVEGAGTP